MGKKKNFGVIPHWISTPLPIVYESDCGFSVYPYLDLKLAEEGKVWGIRCGDRLWKKNHEPTCSKRQFDEKMDIVAIFKYRQGIPPDLPTCEQLETAFKYRLDFDNTVRILITYGISAGYWKDGSYLTEDMNNTSDCCVYDMSKGQGQIQSINEDGFVRLCYPAY